MTIAEVTALFVRAGCERLYAKPLAENDNSKNQVYFGPGFAALTLFPNRGVNAHPTAEALTYRAGLDFSWMSDTGRLSPAPSAQLILYAQYPEVRFSGFLRGCADGPNELYNCRLPGRILFLGVTRQRQVIGYTAAGGSELALEFGVPAPTVGVFVELPLPVAAQPNQQVALLAELCRIHNLGWIRSKRLDAQGNLLACEARNCGGYTLEAELGVRPNAEAEPDVFGFEVKQHRVAHFGGIGSARITLLTPEPNGGSYYRGGAERFIRRYGRAAADGNRIDFVGTHRVGVRHRQTGLTLTLVDFNAANGIILGERGRIALVNDEGEEAASWGFAELMDHWARKHAHAVYVPCRKRTEAPLAYSYGARVRLAQEPDFLRLLTAMANGQVRYDPGSKIENAAAARSQTKARSQFRIGAANIGTVYAQVETVNACG